MDEVNIIIAHMSTRLIEKKSEKERREGGKGRKKE